MKTTLDIPEDELKEAIRHTGAKTKREAVVIALSEFNRRHRLQVEGSTRQVEGSTSQVEGSTSQVEGST